MKYHAWKVSKRDILELNQSCLIRSQRVISRSENILKRTILDFQSASHVSQKVIWARIDVFENRVVD